jgi:hypothetical protein
MPNWCYNQIKVQGEPKDIKKISDIIKNLKKERVDGLFESLIGLPDGIDVENYNKNWYEINCAWFGTKWDIVINFVEEIGENYIFFSGNTALSPPKNFCIELSKKYNVRVEMYFDESGCDFCGKRWIDSEGVYKEEVYTYQEGIYRLKGFQEWYDREWEYTSEYLLEAINEEDNPDFQMLIKYYLPFLNNEEVNKLLEEFKRDYPFECVS